MHTAPSACALPLRIDRSSIFQVNYFIFAALVVACFVSIGSLFFNSSTHELSHWTDNESNDQYTWTDTDGVVHPYNATFASFSLDRLKDNLYPKDISTEQCEAAAAFGSGTVTGQVCDLRLVFSIVFPAVVGMMEGANLSGDLKDPAYSIPVGTWAAVSTAFICYLLLIIGQAGTVSRVALQFDMNVMQHSTVGDGWFVITGVTAACLSTALGSMFGSARILQAIAKDEMYPCLKFFAKGTQHGDEPRRGVVLSYLIAQCGILLGNLDDVAPILTNFFLCTYCLVNLACFLLVLSSVPNFRPTYRMFSGFSSIMGSVLIVIIMFYLQWIYAVITFGVVAALFVYVTITFKGTATWAQADITQALAFRFGRWCLLKGTVGEENPKYWRPNVLLLNMLAHTAPQPSFPKALMMIDRAKQSGALMVGQPVLSDAAGFNAPAVQQAQDNLKTLINSHTAKAFSQIAVATTLRQASQNLLLNSGTGRMMPNTLAVSLDQCQADGCVNAAQVLTELLRDALDMKKNLVVLGNAKAEKQAGWLKQTSTAATEIESTGWFHNSHLQQQETSLEGLTVDVWIFGQVAAPDDHPAGGATVTDDDLLMSILLQLSYLDAASRSSSYSCSSTSGCCVRLLQMVSKSSVDADESKETLRRWLHHSRIPGSSCEIVEAPEQLSGVCAGDWGWVSDMECVRAVQQTIKQHSSQAVSVHMSLPPPNVEVLGLGAEDYLSRLHGLVNDLPPCFLVHNGERQALITTAI